MAATSDFSNEISGFRIDEHTVRLVFVEHSREYADLVCETLERARAGVFDVHHTDHLERALRDVERGCFDAVLVDGTVGTGALPRDVSIEAASSLAIRVPVIVLTGSEDEPALRDPQAAPEPTDEPSFRMRMEKSRVPEAILAAVRRYRRLGQHGVADPIVLRDPLRAFARAFARLRRSIAA
jgi:hypothetical protein